MRPRSVHPRGFTLIEVLVALGIFGFVGIGILAGLGTGFRAQQTNRDHVVAENLSRNALEQIRSLPYQEIYALTVPIPAGYSLAVETATICPVPVLIDGKTVYEYQEASTCSPLDDIQRNTVQVSRGDKPLLFIEDLRVRRVEP